MNTNLLHPALVVVGYNRPKSLERLLKSLAAAHYPAGLRIPLVISLDKSDRTDVLDLALSFEWQHGEKRVLAREENLGLRRHILACGELTAEYGAILLFEDDLFLSPYFYSYAIGAFEAYRHDPRIAGISLYSHRYNETACRPFEPLEDGRDVFFMRLAASSGEGWTREQWQSFRTWYEAHPDPSQDPFCLPQDIQNWPERSWKKHFNRYLSAHDRYFVYPRVGLSTNFSDAGANIAYDTNIHQVPLAMGERQHVFPSLDDSLAVYDTHLEILPDRLSRLNPELERYDFEVDLNGTKELQRITRPLVLTSRPCTDRILGFGLKLRPQELNPAQGISGSELSLAKVSSVRREHFTDRVRRVMREYSFDTPFLAYKKSILYGCFRWGQKLLGRLSS